MSTWLPGMCGRGRISAMAAAAPTRLSPILFALLVMSGSMARAGDVNSPTAVDIAAVARATHVPLGLPPMPIPAGNPLTPEKVALGRKLFLDRRLSANGTMSCAMCHVPEHAFTNHEVERSVGINGQGLRRNAPSNLNAGYMTALLHDGRETSLETQPLGPLLAHDEMANPSAGWLVARIAALPDYAVPFARAFGGGPSVERIGQALAAWQRTLVAGNSRFDRYHFGGDRTALTLREQSGLRLFTGKAGCIRCHTIEDQCALFTDGGFHNTGIGAVSLREGSLHGPPVPVEIAPNVFVPLERAAIHAVGRPGTFDLGRAEVTEDPADRWRFRTPSLRNVALTAPYMHDGSLHSLEDVVQFYNRGGEPNGNLDPMIQPLELSPTEIEDLVAFLGALTGDNIAELVADARSAPVGN